MRVRIAPAALAEAEDARDWYDAVRAGLGEEFWKSSIAVCARLWISRMLGIPSDHAPDDIA